MTITTTQAILYSLAFFMSVCVISFNYSTVRLSRIHGDLIRAQYEQAANIQIALMDAVVSRNNAQAEKYNAIKKIWRCQ